MKGKVSEISYRKSTAFLINSINDNIYFRALCFGAVQNFQALISCARELKLYYEKYITGIVLNLITKLYIYIYIYIYKTKINW
jgi:hypothetical protein